MELCWDVLEANVRRPLIQFFPSASDGFANNERLYICLAEVFKIYMKEKTEGTIQSSRAFALYCLSNQKLG